MTYTLFYGPDLKDVLRTYTGMTGRPALPPAWSFGLWLSTSFTTSYDEKSVTAMIDTRWSAVRFRFPSSIWTASG